MSIKTATNNFTNYEDNCIYLINEQAAKKEGVLNLIPFKFPSTDSEKKEFYEAFAKERVVIYKPKEFELRVSAAKLSEIVRMNIQKIAVAKVEAQVKSFQKFTNEHFLLVANFLKLEFQTYNQLGNFYLFVLEKISDDKKVITLCPFPFTVKSEAERKQMSETMAKNQLIFIDSKDISLFFVEEAFDQLQDVEYVILGDFKIKVGKLEILANEFYQLIADRNKNFPRVANQEKT